MAIANTAGVFSLPQTDFVSKIFASVEQKIQNSFS